MFCSRCGSQVVVGAPFCAACGSPQTPGASQYANPGALVPRPAIRCAKADGAKWIGQGWDVVKSDLPMFALHTVLFSLVSGALPLILQGPMTVGLQYAIMRRAYAGRTEVGDLFKGFNYAVPAIVAGILVWIFSSVGFLLCLIPGLFVLAALQFPFLLIFDKGMDFWPAMETSLEAAKKDWGGYLVFLLLQMVVVFVGFLACFVGLLVAVPVMHAATVAAYDEVFGFEQRTIDQARAQA
ncbi:MAG: zinc-ribbon domain-containing protein [Acidobacteria bacterium]|nr:zinc-ribbon domain-containing protein [Acidobacteriota bacterium]